PDWDSDTAMTPPRTSTMTAKIISFLPVLIRKNVYSISLMDNDGRAGFVTCGRRYAPARERFHKRPTRAPGRYAGVAPLCPVGKIGTKGCESRPAGRGKIAGPGLRNSERRTPAGERLPGRGETGWMARTQGGREPQRGWMPREDSRPTEDNARRPVSPRPAPRAPRGVCGRIG